MSAAHLRCGPATMQVLYMRAWSDGFQAGAALGYAAGVTDAYTLGCGGKMKQSKESATATLDRRGALTSGARGAAYRCRECGSWHTAHKAECPEGS